jgi:hypothetical protein
MVKVYRLSKLDKQRFARSVPGWVSRWGWLVRSQLGITSVISLIRFIKYIAQEHIYTDRTKQILWLISPVTGSLVPETFNPVVALLGWSKKPWPGRTRIYRPTMPTFYTLKYTELVWFKFYHIPAHLHETFLIYWANSARDCTRLGSTTPGNASLKGQCQYSHNQDTDLRLTVPTLPNELPYIMLPNDSFHIYKSGKNCYFIWTVDTIH